MLAPPWGGCRHCSPAGGGIANAASIAALVQAGGDCQRCSGKGATAAPLGGRRQPWVPGRGYCQHGGRHCGRCSPRNCQRCLLEGGLVQALLRVNAACAARVKLVYCQHCSRGGGLYSQRTLDETGGGTANSYSSTGCGECSPRRRRCLRGGPTLVRRKAMWCWESASAGGAGVPIVLTAMLIGGCRRC